MSDAKTSALDAVVRDLVAGNRILAHEGIVDAMGHISARHPGNPKRYLLAWARSPGLVEAGDIMEFELDGTPIDGRGRPVYIERHIHGAIYESRPEVMSVIHNHCQEVLPFAITRTPMRPAVHTARRLGNAVPVWDIHDRFGDTDLLVTTMEQGRDLASVLRATKAVLMRGHGCAVTGDSIPDAVHSAIAMKGNARAIIEGLALGGEITYLTPGEVTAEMAGRASLKGFDRAWEYLCRRAGVKA
jgi:HCOMODA/2-hydroxy-3-carboxy-muconic semialdehyde decarboxylase